jgi:transposase
MARSKETSRPLRWPIATTPGSDAGADHPTLRHRARVAATGQLKALIVGAPEEVRAELRGRSTANQIQHCASLRARPTRSLEHRATVQALRATAQRIQSLAAKADQLQAELTVLVQALAPWLLEIPGVGPLSAAQVARENEGFVLAEAAKPQVRTPTCCYFLRPTTRVVGGGSAVPVSL